MFDDPATGSDVQSSPFRPPAAAERMPPLRRSQSFPRVGLATLAIAVASTAACTADAAPAARESAEIEVAARPVRPGVEVLLSDSLHLVRGRRVGLITNHTGIVGTDTGVRSTIDLLHERPEVDLVALYGPEHGLRGEAEAGEKVDDGVDDRTGLPVFSLYGSTRAPTAEMLEGIDVLLFDIQDIGTRYYTYVWTMALSLAAAREAGLDFVVLDRPNPLGAQAQGNVLDPDFSSFVGLHPVPMRHGMTPGEVARWIQARAGGDGGVREGGNAPALPADDRPAGADQSTATGRLHVVPVDGWRPSDGWPDALPWVAPSPNMPDLVSALHYPGTCLFEGTNLSVGRGTERPFQWLGAPFLDGEVLAARLNARGLAGVRFEAARFTPRSAGDGKFSGVEVSGVRFVAVDAPGEEVGAATGIESPYDPTEAAAWALLEARRMAGPAWEWRSGHFDRLAGTDALRRVVDRGDPGALEELLAGWRAESSEFARAAASIRIYATGGG